MISRSTRTAWATLLGGLAACHSATRSSSSIPSPPSVPSPASIPSSSIPPSSSLSSEQASRPAEPPDGGAPASPSSDGDRDTRAPAIDTAFVPIELRFEQRPEGTTGVSREIARRFPVIGEEGRTIAILDERQTIEEGSSLHLVLLDIRTNKNTVFTLWAESPRANRRQEAQRILSSSRWQSLVPGETLRGEDSPTSSAVRFEAEEFQFVESATPFTRVELLRRTRSGERKLALVPQGLPGKLGPAAVPTKDVGATCGWWDGLQAGWVSQGGKVHLFMLRAILGGRCGTSPTPVEYGSWVSP